MGYHDSHDRDVGGPAMVLGVLIAGALVLLAGGGVMLFRVRASAERDRAMALVAEERAIVAVQAEKQAREAAMQAEKERQAERASEAPSDKTPSDSTPSDSTPSDSTPAGDVLEIDLGSEIDASAFLAEAPPITASRAQQLIIAIDMSGGASIEGKAHSLEQLDARLEEEKAKLAGASESLAVMIRAHRQCPFEHVVAIMDLCQKLDVQDVNLGIEEASSESPAP